jgi:hypothetical protein
MTVLTLQWPRLTLNRTAAARGLTAGALWGAALTVGLTALTYWSCGTVCLDDVINTAVVGTAAGIVTMGPLAAFGGRAT